MSGSRRVSAIVVAVLGYLSICVSECVGVWVSGRLGDWVSVCM